MEIRQLRYLLTIAEESNFTRAAEKLYVSQSALSQQIQILEQELGTTLLDRSRRGARLTAAGEILCQHARRAFHELETAQIALNELEGLQRGSLVVGVVQTINAYLMPRIVARFAALYPAIRLTVQELPADEIEQGLESGKLQAGIGFIPTASSELDVEPLFVEDLVFIVPCQHPLAGQSAVQAADLSACPLVMLPRTFCTRRLWDASAQTAGIQPQVLLEMNTISGILSTVLHTGMGTILPELALADDKSGELLGIRIHNPTPSRTVGLLSLRGAYQCAATRAFMQLVREAITSQVSV
jgi:LysR family transcriptional regulator, cyn operon transcriptional activator